MHTARQGPALDGLDQGLQHDNAHGRVSDATLDVVEVARKTLTVHGSDNDQTAVDISHLGEALQEILLVVWILLLQRECGHDDPVGQIFWGHTLNGSQTSHSISLSELNVQPISAREEPVSSLLDELSRTVRRFGPTETIFFQDVPLTKHQKGVNGIQETSWTFRLEVTKKGEELTLQAFRRDTGAGLTARQAEERFETFDALLEIAIRQPETPIPDLLGPLERDLDQIWQWNSNVPPTLDRCVHEIISEQVARCPDKVAVSSWDGQYTYAEVELLSTRLAHHLCSQGVVLGTIVPLFFEKSRYTIVAVLAVMKAGGAFALTDPTSQPEARLRVMVEQTGARVVVASESQTELASRVVPEGGKVLTFSDDVFSGLTIPDGELGVLPAIPPSETPLYIQFTSGSTGKPKGVVISHANYTSGAIPRAAAVGYKETSRVFEFASYAFDVSIDCMLCTLAAGGTICIPSDADRMNDLGGAIRASGANMAHMTPSVARVLDPDVLAGLDVLGLGGEAVSAADAAAWSSGGTGVIIAYGPSECTVGCTVNNTFSQKGETKRSFTTGNIGKGVGAVGWVVDPENPDRLVPVGAVGELLIEGPVVGLGYLGEPEKTAEVFIDAPAWLTAGYGAVPGRRGRLYKTGDLVRYDPDMSGDFVFVGRKDAQVKLRGQRVELVEIEHHLHGLLPRGVKLAAEVIKPIGGQPTLVAFVVDDSEAADVLTPGSSDEASEHGLGFSGELAEALAGIDEALAVDLPRYMVPAAYIRLREMPSLVSGKTDRKKLREIGAGMTREQISGSLWRPNQNSQADSVSGPPESEMEIALCSVWKTVLGLKDDVSVRDSFFAVGGDSLRAMKLVSVARAEGIALTVADVFRYPILQDMAVVSTRVSHHGPQSSSSVQPFGLLEADWPADDAREEAARLCGVDSCDVEDVYPCTPLQEALMALSAKVKEAYVAQRVLKLDNPEAAGRLQAAFEAVAADSAILRTRIIHSDYGLMQVVVKEPISWRTGASLAEYLEHDRNEPTDLGRPLVRYAMIHGADGSHFVLTMHHALYDGWSMPLIVERVNQAYQKLPLSRPAAEFKDFIHYLKNVRDQDACDEYWRNQLQGATGQQFPALPFEGYQTKADSLLEIDISLGGRRLPSSSQSTITLATIVRAAWALVASQYCRGNSDMVFGETLTGRNAPIAGADEIEGPMITTVPFRVRIERDLTVQEYLEAVAEQTIAQIPYEHAGLQHIRRLSDDALQACELRTGLVLHPAAGEVAVDENTPANGLVPAGDAEAAQEALKFNTYALMLVCSLSTDGFFVMASFDSHTVDKPMMERVLEQLRLVVHQLCEDGAGTLKIGDVECLVDSERQELELLIRQVIGQGVELSDFGLAADEVEALWIVDAADSQRLVPVGAAGEVLVETRKHLAAPAVAVTQPKWLHQINGVEEKEVRAKFFRLGRLGRIVLDAENNPALEVLGESQQQVKPNAKISPPSASSAVTASSAKQKTLRAIWSRLLSVEEGSIFLGDSFFHRGGDSITAMKLVSEVRRNGMQLTVAQVFAHRTLYDMASVMQPAVAAAGREKERQVTPLVYNPFSALLFSMTGRIREQLADKSWKILDILPTRPLQEIAVRGTVEQPRFSIRYEAVHFAGSVDKARLFRACQDLIARNQILRTVFVRLDGACFGVVLDDLGSLPLVEYEIEDDDDIEAFTSQLCRLDAQTRMPYGSSFVKWLFVTNSKRSTLVFRLSHAQYDEMCLPIFLHQLHQLYQGVESVPISYPFSAFVNHTLTQSIPRAIPYWHDLLGGSKGITPFRPDIPVTDRRHFAIHRTVDIAPRTRDVTVATFPSAAWALALARLSGTKDVIFGEVASGRGVDVPGVADANAITGPCWQYIPTRVQFSQVKTGYELLAAVQAQHMASAAHDGIGLEEIVRDCTDWDDWKEGGWFDTVVHQDVAHVEELKFGGDVARMETIYPYEEPLREWKVQAFYDSRREEMTMEVITFMSWSEEAKRVLDGVCAALGELVGRPGGELCL
ncbi:Nonribosomal peptide synthetase 4 [Echria macrotheca]|uniref:Nonribosomal peptide synthetase 4 n=1 Tax=Echria macrotheca TaxID=438768 RepID=A0AAJ0B4I0_9PEZI|nr:Nonribosomal peptide synthetase 4 [Echria macrotheca]